MKDLAQAVTPVGSVLPYAGVVIDEETTGWMFCDGRELDVKAHPTLFAALKYSYGGKGDHFHIPDMRGRVPVGRTDMQTDDRKSSESFNGNKAEIVGHQLGSVGGSAVHQLDDKEMPKHNHEVKDEGHEHSFALRHNTAVGPDNEVQHADAEGRKFGDHRTKPESADIKQPDKGGSESHNNVQPSIILNYIIRYR